MNDLEHSSDFSGSSNADPHAFENLRKIVLAALVSMLILAGSLNIFLLRQMVFMRKDLDAVRPQVKLIVENYQKVEDPQIRSFVNALANYGRTHPDFQTIIAKYKVSPQAPAATAPKAAPTAPAVKK